MLSVCAVMLFIQAQGEQEMPEGAPYAIYTDSTHWFVTEPITA